MEHKVESSLRINAPVDKVWGILNDFSGVEKFSIGVERSPIIGDKISGLGAKRHCVFYDQSSVVEEIIEYEESKSFKVELSEFTIPMKAMCAGFSVEKISEASCEVSMHMNFTVKFGLLGALMGLVMMRPVLKGVQKKLLSGLAYHACTGETVGSELPSNEVITKALAV